MRGTEQEFTRKRGKGDQSKDHDKDYDVYTARHPEEKRTQLNSHKEFVDKAIDLASDILMELEKEDEPINFLKTEQLSRQLSKVLHSAKVMSLSQREFRSLATYDLELNREEINGKRITKEDRIRLGIISG